jgi:hypothetical protein
MPRRRPQSDEDADKLSSVEMATALRSAGELAQIHPEERVGSIGSLVGSPYRALGVSQEKRPDPDALRLFVLEDFLPRMGADAARVPSARRRMTPSLAHQHLTHGFLIRCGLPDPVAVLTFDRRLSRPMRDPPVHSCPSDRNEASYGHACHADPSDLDDRGHQAK